MDHASFPKLPNSKPDLKALKEMATKHVGDEGELFLDFGSTKKASKGELFENAVIHRCCAFWMLGVLTDHNMRGFSNAAFCTRISSASSCSAPVRMRDRRRTARSFV